ncbi:MAG: DUF1800 domain-containing protein, partial [Caballeronia sp.]
MRYIEFKRPSACVVLCAWLAMSVWAHAALPSVPGRANHARAVEAAGVDDLLEASDARFLLTRTGFAANAGEVSALSGMTREQAVDNLLTSVRTEATT